MKLPSLKIGDLTAKIPIIQGGMGACVSLSSLASAVAREGGIGIISAVHPGFKEEDFETNNLAANIRALKNEIRKAKELAPSGIIGMNIMVAMKNYKEYVQAALEEKIDIIISGAGLPLDLPELVKGTATKIVPIVSSAKAALVIAKMWDKKNNVAPDAVIVEGPEAGGHLGFSNEELASENPPQLLDIVKDVKKTLETFAAKYNKEIPVIAAGGIFDGKDIADAIKAGAAGVQMATRFVATDECDADINFKMAYVNAKQEDVVIVKSPVGMPGRAIKNEFLEKLMEEEKLAVTKCYSCIKPCNPKQTPYCISQALLESVKGHMASGLIFTGAKVYKIKEIVSVKNLMNELVLEAQSNL
jgi:NAD(P)H-dependent flavin oxidoreductase YrpB (nitropropane dioxygenase family)